MGLKFFQWRSLKTRVTVLTLLLFVVSIWSLALYASRMLRTDMQQVMGEQQFSTVSAIAREINEHLKNRQQALETIAKGISPKLLAKPSALQAMLQQRPLLQLLFNGGVFVTGLDGVAVADVPHSAGRVGTNYMDRESVSIPLREGKTVIGKPAMGKKLGAPLFSITAPILASDGKPVGALVGTINLGQPNFLDQIAQTRYGKTGSYLLIARQHQLIITASDKTRVMQPSPAPALNTMHDRYMQGFEGYGVAVSSRGVLELSAAKAIPSANWIVVATLPAKEAFAPIDDMLQRLFLNAAVLTALAGVLTWWLISRLLQHQLAPLLSASRSLLHQTRSDQPVQMLPVQRPDEIGELIGGFNLLLESSARREKALVQSEARFRQLFEKNSSVMLLIEPASGDIVDANAAALDYYGYSSQQLVGLNISAINTLPAEVVAVQRQSVLNSKRNYFLFSHQLASGETRDVEVHSTPIETQGRSLLFSIIYDVHERVQAQKALQESEQNLAITLRSIGDAVIATDPAGCITRMNPTAEQLTGWPLADAINRPLAEVFKIINAETRLTVPDPVQLVMALGHVIDLANHTVLLARDGQEYQIADSAAPIRNAAGEIVGVVLVFSDVTESYQAELALRLSEQRYRSLLDHLSSGVVVHNPDRSILYANATAATLFRLTQDQTASWSAQAQDWQLLQEDGTPMSSQDYPVNRVLASGESLNNYVVGVHHVGHAEPNWALCSAFPLRDAEQNLLQVVVTFTDITDRKLQQSQLEHIAHFDALTNLPNRVLLADRLQLAMAQAQRRGQQLAVVFLDLDGFKNINDRHGHGIGDQLLISLAKAMKDALREGDTLARIGGDEFVAVLSDLDNLANCVPMLTRLLEAAAAPVYLGELLLQASASLGVTFFPQAQEIDADQLLRQADQAMYQAKVAGKNRYHIFDAAQDTSIRGHHESLERIRLALAQDEFVLYYQPKVNMRCGQVIGVEALIRWQHPEKGLLAPAAFLPVIEDHPLAVAVGEWVIDTTLTQIERWHESGLDLRQVSVNVGARQLQQGDFVERLQFLLAKHPKVNPANLQIEVLETSALSDMALVSQVIEDCARFGVMFALDDFGTGYSSLTYLKRLHVNILKIDQSFVRDMLEDPDDLAILQGVIGLAAAFKRQVIAEGVETVAHGTALLHLGCELAQGYGIARPMPAAQLQAWASAWQADAAWAELA
ncbi:EAL domain-containing protein [Rhodoferax sp. U11-2br]|uniref:EAL domain-containing protein n=1 Tax=Rhodoferax sp. U11-2br TaxID=2838878 RepID=UPI001BE63445|nr:EAL domain-containing protein [Rhodoferax sp. U11-2br]MBT3065554.1 EAL domain-containing protein [Rhodoferax sp. U11-2br]